MDIGQTRLPYWFLMTLKSVDPRIYAVIGDSENLRNYTHSDETYSFLGNLKSN